MGYSMFSLWFNELWLRRSLNHYENMPYPVWKSCHTGFRNLSIDSQVGVRVCHSNINVPWKCSPGNSMSLFSKGEYSKFHSGDLFFRIRDLSMCTFAFFSLFKLAYVKEYSDFDPWFSWTLAKYRKKIIQISGHCKGVFINTLFNNNMFHQLFQNALVLYVE